jgi:hypothetical protein
MRRPLTTVALAGFALALVAATGTPPAQAAPGVTSENPPELAKALVTPDDFDYVGSFTAPTGDYFAYYIEYLTGLTTRWKDGRLVLYSLNQGGEVVEFPVPALDDLSTTTPYPFPNEYTRYGDVYQDKITETAEWHTPDNPGVGLANVTHPTGLFWDEQDQRLYWSKVTAYDTSYLADTNLGYATLDDATGTGTGAGSWSLPTDGFRWAFTPLALPGWFADAYTGGRRLGLGFGGYISIAGNGVSLGPALYAFQPPDLATSPHLSELAGGAVALVSHIHGKEAPAARPSGVTLYLPGDGVTDEWYYTDTSPYGVWVEGEHRHGVIVFETFAAGDADTAVVAQLAPDVIQVADPGDIRAGDLIMVGTEYASPADPCNRFEGVRVQAVDAATGTITLTAPSRGRSR